jgi:hypothetical protein
VIDQETVKKNSDIPLTLPSIQYIRFTDSISYTLELRKTLHCFCHIFLSVISLAQPHTHLHTKVAETTSQHIINGTQHFSLYDLTTSL